jgi:hypothetical protein
MSSAAAIGRRTESCPIASRLAKEQADPGAQPARDASVAACVGTAQRLSLAGSVPGRNAQIAPRDLSALTSAFNFGPNRDANRTVEELVEEVLRHWPGRWQDKTDPNAPHEAGLLQLSTDKAPRPAALVPGLVLFRSGGQTVQWYRKAGTSKRQGISKIDPRSSY